MLSLRTPLSVAAALASSSCGGSTPEPRVAPPPASLFVAVPGPPPAARVEVVRERPKAQAVWVDGGWLWEGIHWRWVDGGWFAAPPGYRYSRWSTQRRDDGTLLFAGPQWFDERGNPVGAPQRLASASAIGGGSDTEE